VKGVRIPGLFVALLLVVGTLLVYSTPNARAVTQTTWTSTTDFDAGTKSDPGNPYFANFALDQPTNWINYPSAVYYSGRTYVAWQGDAGWRPYLSVYDHATTRWSGPYLIATSNPLAGSQDGHGSPSILIDATGRIHVFFGSHSSPQKYSTSTVADPSAWTVMGDPDASATYPHPVQYGTSLYLFFRQGSLPNAPESYRVSTDGGSTWGARQAFLNFAVGAVYLWGSEQYGSRWYFTFNYYSPTSGLRHSLYAGYFDFSNLHVFSVGGTDLGSDADLNEANTSLRIENTIGSAWQILSLGIHLDPSGSPYLIYRSGADPSNWRFNFTRWTGSAWTTPNVTILTTDSGIFNEGDFIVRSSTNIEAYLVGPGIHGSGGDVQRWDWNGVSWSQGATILTQRASSKPLSEPFVPVGFQEDFKIWFAQTDMPNYTRPQQRLYAWGMGGFLNDTASGSGTWSAETTTDDAQVASGAAELSSGKGDTFTRASSSGNTSRWNFGLRVATGQSLAGACQAFVIAGGVATASVAKDQATECDLSSTFTVSGNFDVRVKTSTPVDGSGRRAQLCVANEPLACDYGLAYSSTMKGFVYGHDVDSSAYALNISGGTFTQIGSTSAISADPFWERIDRSGNTFNFRYSTDGSAWTLDETIVRGDAPSSFIVTLAYVNNGVTDGTGTFDDFNVVAGTIDAGGYRSRGSWTSPLTDTGRRPIAIALTTASPCVNPLWLVDYVALLDAQGNSVWRADADLPCGTAQTVEVPGNVPAVGIWRVQVGLKGDGAGSPILTDVAADVPTGDGASVENPRPMWTYELAGPIGAAYGCTVQFRDATVLPEGRRILYWSWDFGDGSSSNVQNPLHEYANCGWLRGAYPVTLKVTLENLSDWYAPGTMGYDRIMFVAMLFVLAIAFAVSRLARIRRRELRAVARALRR
jgi:putative BNR repeat neuraminidase/PKD domain-containing protein